MAQVQDVAAYILNEIGKPGGMSAMKLSLITVAAAGDQDKAGGRCAAGRMTPLEATL